MELDAIRAHLLAEMEEIDRLDQISAKGRQAVELNQTSIGRLSRADAMHTMQQQAMAIEAQRRRHLRRQRVEAALRRIGEGEFGHCIICGEPIPQERLEIDFTVPTCLR